MPVESGLWTAWSIDVSKFAGADPRICGVWGLCAGVPCSWLALLQVACAGLPLATHVVFQAFSKFERSAGLAREPHGSFHTFLNLRCGGKGVGARFVARGKSRREKGGEVDVRGEA